MLAAFNFETELGFDGVEHADGLLHDFGTDSVAGENSDAVSVGHGVAMVGRKQGRTASKIQERKGAL